MKIRQVSLIVCAILGGEIALILFATIAQEVLFNGITYNTSSMSEILFGGLATFVAAILAGLAARLIIKYYEKVVPIAISIIITVEMTYLINTNKTGDPAWFDIMGGLSLIIGIWLGFSYTKFISRSKHKAADRNAVM